ncbi:MAG: DUF1592 domain-containing protein [Planctomycetia bacterium]|nr:DUF1592 domain-containing protein [Planctomycetia bacterium]
MPHHRRTLATSILSMFGLVVLAVCMPTQPPNRLPAAEEATRILEFKTKVEPFLTTYCADCHFQGKNKGNTQLDGLLSGDIATKDTAQLWQNVLDVITEGTMPPRGKPRAAAAQTQAFVERVNKDLAEAAKVFAGSNKPVLRRLNKREYENSIEELFGFRPNIGTRFPDDGLYQRFDTVGSALFMSDYQLDRYLEIAQEIVSQALPDAMPKSEKQTYPGDSLRYYPGFSYGDMPREPVSFYKSQLERYEALSKIKGGLEGQAAGLKKPTPPTREMLDQYAWLMKNHLPWEKQESGATIYMPLGRGRQYAGLTFPTKVPVAGYYRITIEAGSTSPTPWDKDVNALAVVFPRNSEIGKQQPDPNILFTSTVEGDVQQPERIIIPSLYLSPETTRSGLTITRAVRLEQINQSSGENTEKLILVGRQPRPMKTLSEVYRGLYIRSVTVEGPIVYRNAMDQLFPGGMPSQYSKTAAAQALQRFMSKALRRPVTIAEAEGYLKNFKIAGRDSFMAGMRDAVALVISSPDFVYQAVERRSDGKPARLSPHELATRLSFFLWNQTPDDRLLALADNGTLTKPDVLRSEVERLLNDPRHQRFVASFTTAWLELGRLDEVAVDSTERFPQFSGGMKDLLKRETIEFIRTVLDEDLSLLNIVESDWMILNQRLAQFYGIDGVTGPELRKVKLTPEQRRQRGGIITQGSILTMTSNGTRTTPVVRGGWIMKAILGATPPPPPPNVKPLEDQGARDISKMTIRQLLEEHRRIPACAACHQKIDSYGLAFENYDAIGRWRTMEQDYREVAKGVAGVKRSVYKWVDVGPVEASGTLYSGEKFQTPQEVRQIILRQREAVARNFLRNLLTYALGRATDIADQPTIDQLQGVMTREGYKIKPAIQALVASEAFLTK